MKYVGSKARISRHILPIIQGAIDRNGIETYVEPFVGGGNLIDKVHCQNRIGYDNNEYLIGFWQALQTGWNPGTVPMSKELYTQIKDYKELFRPESDSSTPGSTGGNFFSNSSGVFGIP